MLVQRKTLRQNLFGSPVQLRGIFFRNLSVSGEAVNCLHSLHHLSWVNEPLPASTSDQMLLKRMNLKTVSCAACNAAPDLGCADWEMEGVRSSWVREGFI